MSRSELSSASTKGGAVLSSYKDQSAAKLIKDGLAGRLSHDVGRSGAMTAVNSEVALGFKTFTSSSENVPSSSTAVRTEFFARDSHQRKLRQRELKGPDDASNAAAPFAGLNSYLPKSMPPRLPPLEKPEWTPASAMAGGGESGPSEEAPQVVEVETLAAAPNDSTAPRAPVERGPVATDFRPNSSAAL